MYWLTTIRTHQYPSIVKQDIFYDDVNHTVATLKKVVQEMQTIISADLQMNQSTGRYDPS